MGDVLSQSEIDNLLQQISTGDVDVDDISGENQKQIRNYDFLRPAKFSKEHLRTLENIFEHYGRLLSSNLPVYLRKQVQVEVMSAEATTYSEFSNALSNPVLLGIVNFAPLKGNIIFELATTLGYAVIDRMLGGYGNTLERNRDFSEIELIIVEKVMNICIDLLKEPWAGVVEIEPKLEKIETNSQFAQVISPNEMIAIVTINMKIGSVEGLINICLPFMTIESVMDKLNTKYWYSAMQEKDDKIYAEAIEKMIQKTKIPVKTILGKSIISVNDFVNMQKGDIIRLNTEVDSELEIYVGNIKKFTALPGAADDKYAVRITSIIREE